MVGPPFSFVVIAADAAMDAQVAITTEMAMAPKYSYLFSFSSRF